jgi:hypothetical protein
MFNILLLAAALEEQITALVAVVLVVIDAM